MALTRRQQAQLNTLLATYCETRVPEHVRDKLRLGYRIRGHEVVLFEERPEFGSPHTWSEFAVAKFKYVSTQEIWRLYCQHRDLRWHEYRARPTARQFKTLLKEVDADPTGIFWG